MTDILQPDNERHSPRDNMLRRRNEVVYAFHNISILGHREQEEPKKHPMHHFVATGNNFDSTPSVSNHEPTTTSTQNAAAEEILMLPKAKFMAQVEQRPTNNQTPLNSSAYGFNETSTEERERLARQARIEQELEQIYEDKPEEQ